MSAQAKYTQFLLQLADLGCTLQLPQLRDSARALLNIMPADQFTGRYRGFDDSFLSDLFWLDGCFNFNLQILHLRKSVYLL